MRKLVRQFFMQLSIIPIVLIIIGLLANGYAQYHQTLVQMNETLKNCKELLNQDEENYWLRFDLLKQDFLNRLDAVEFIMAHATSDKEPVSLTDVKSELGLKELYFLDENGIIQASSDESILGTVFPQAEAIVGQRKEGSETAYGFYTVKSSDGTTVTRFGVIKRFEEGGFAYCAADYPLHVDNNLIVTRNEFFQHAIAAIPTDYNTTIMGINTKTGEILGITSNNPQEVEYPGKDAGEKFQTFLSAIQEKPYKLFRVNNQLVVAAVQAYDADVALVGFLNLDNVIYQEAVINVLVIVLIVGAGYTVSLLLFNRMIRRVFYDDIHENAAMVRRLMDGDYSVEFKPCKTEELEELLVPIRMLRDVYISKEGRMNRVLNDISPDVASFELMGKNRSVFLSDNLASVMHLSKEEMEQFKSNVHAFWKLVVDLRTQANERDVVYFRGKYLVFHLHSMKDGLVGLIFDRTEAEKSRKKLENQLRLEREEKMQDSLTGLMNRRGIQMAIEERLKEDRHGKGMLMIFDMDNFKSINDFMGHPEGDKVLALFAQVLRRFFRKEDIIGRLGGDEFVVFLSDPLEGDLLPKKMEALLTAVREALREYEKYQSSVSVGISRIDEAAGVADYDTLYRSADAALYIAKKNGKGRYYLNDRGI